MANTSLDLKQGDQVVSMLEQWFSKLPALPPNAREMLVKVAPWIALVFGILGILGSLGGVLALLGLGALGTMALPFGGATVVGASAVGIAVMILGLVSSVLLLMAYPGLKGLKMAGWRLAFWSEVVGLLGSLVSLNIVGLVIGAVIGFYILFQIKSYYK